MAVLVDPGLMDGAAMRPTESFDNTGDPVHSLTMVANSVWNLWKHRHIDGEGQQIPPAGLTGDVLKRAWFYAQVGD